MLAFGFGSVLSLTRNLFFAPGFASNATLALLFARLKVKKKKSILVPLERREFWPKTAFVLSVPSLNL